MNKPYRFPDSLYKRLKFLDDGCIEFTGANNGRGYGQLKVNGKQRYAHRLAYESEVGPIPEGLTLDHLCRNPACVNVDHLEAVTHQVNVRRGDAGWRNAVKTHCPHGHEFNEDNTYYYSNGWRQCRACNNLQRREKRLQKARTIE